MNANTTKAGRNRINPARNAVTAPSLRAVSARTSQERGDTAQLPALGVDADTTDAINTAYVEGYLRARQMFERTGDFERVLWALALLVAVLVGATVGVTLSKASNIETSVRLAACQETVDTVIAECGGDR